VSDEVIYLRNQLLGRGERAAAYRFVRDGGEEALNLVRSEVVGLVDHCPLPPTIGPRCRGGATKAGTVRVEAGQRFMRRSSQEARGSR